MRRTRKDAAQPPAVGTGESASEQQKTRLLAGGGAHEGVTQQCDAVRGFFLRRGMGSEVRALPSLSVVTSSAVRGR